MSREKRIRVVVAEPGELPEVREVPNTLASMQEVVDGPIEVHPFSAEIPELSLVVSEMGNVLPERYPLNRKTYRHRQSPVWRGVMMVSKIEDGDFVSLNDTEAQLVQAILREAEAA